MKILVLSPHPDDGQMGAGGTISKFIEEGHEVYYIVFSHTEQGFSREEINKARELLGIKKENFTLLNYRVRNFTAVRQQVLEDLIDYRAKIKPDMVLIPSSFDTHQDHQVIHEEGVRAFRNFTLLGYEENWNNITFLSRCFVPLTGKQVDNKLVIADIYKTQKNKIYMDIDLIRARARDRGTYIRTKYAEAFEVIRLII